MTEINQEHVNVVSAAASACLLRISDNCSPVFGRLMRNHAGLLIEVCEFLKHQIALPELPYNDDAPEDVNPEPEKPRDDGTAAKSNGD